MTTLLNAMFSKQSRLSLWLPVLIVLLGYLTGLNLAGQQDAANQFKINEALRARLEQIVQGVRGSVSTYEHGLRGLKGAILAVGVDNFDYDSMQTITRNRSYDEEFPGARGFGFIQFVPIAQREDFVQRSANERPDGIFTIRQLQPHMDDLFVIRFIEPEVRNKQAVGLDIGSEANRRQAAIRAATDNDMRLTGPITLVQASNKTIQGFLILLPIYRNEGLRETGFSNLSGWTYAPLLIDEVLSAISGLDANMVLTITDVTAEQRQEFFTRGEPGSAVLSYQQTSALQLYGREWEVSLAPVPEFIASLSLPKPEASIWNAVLFSLLLAVLLYSAQLVWLRRLTVLQHKHELVKAEEDALLVANATLEQQVAERTDQLVQLSALQRSILDAAAYAIIATDPDGIITEFNPSAERLLGYQSEEVIGLQTPMLFLVCEDMAKRALMLGRQLGRIIPPGFEVLVAHGPQGDVDICHCTYVSKDGTQIPVKLSVTTLCSEKGEVIGFLGIAYDLTEQLAKEQELARAREEALQASRAKSDFLANMSHEIRTPMNAVLGLLQMTLHTQLTKLQQDYVLKTQGAAKSLLALLNDILDFSKIEAGRIELETEPFSLQQLLGDMGNILSSQAQHKAIELLYEVDDEVPDTLIGDCLRLRQVLLNVLSNAVKFTEKGSVITHISASFSNNTCLLDIVITDSGIGMSDEQQQIIFKGFHQADSSISRRYGGTGLGLAITRELVSLMGGSVSVSSTLGVGSSFCIKVPFGFLPSSDLIRPLKSGKVLLVEDNPTTRMVLRGMLQRLGLEVVLCPDSNSALALMQSPQPPRFDAILIDWQLPDSDGLSLAAALRRMQQLPHKPAIVVVTAFSEKLLEAQQNQPVTDYDAILTKPITREMLYTTLCAVLHEPGVTTAPKVAPALTGETEALAGRRLLLVEDNATNRLVATTLLRQQGAVVSEAVDGFEALDLLARESFDLVLMDIQMPGMDGYEATRQIRAKLGLVDLPVIAMTANALPQDRAACEQAGMNGHIAKPFDIADVTQMLLAYLKAGETPTGSLPMPTNGSVLPEEVIAFGKTHGLALEQAFKHLGDIDLYAQVIAQFMEDIAAALTLFAEPGLTCHMARIQYHSLKSVAATCGFKELATQLYTAESACDSQADNQALIAAAPSVSLALEQACELLRSLHRLLTPP